MTLEIAFLFALLVAMVALFLTERLPVEVTAFSGLVVLIFTGYLGPGEAFTGFSSPAVITMLSVFLLSGGLQQTGVAEMLGDRLHVLGGGREVPLIVVLMLVAGGLSAFMNNVAATAVLLPAVASLCRRSGLAPSRLFMPLAFGAILGGTTTLVGTPPNLLAAEVLDERGLTPFELFDFTPLGLVLLVLGILFMVTVGRRLLPAQVEPATALEAGGDLSRVYRLEERLFSIHVPAGSPLDGLTLREARFGTALGVQVVAIVRAGRRHLVPDPDREIHAGDLLLVEGRLQELQELLRLQGVTVEEKVPLHLGQAPGPVEAALLHLDEGSPLADKTPAELAFRQRHGAVIAAVSRQGKAIPHGLARHRFAAGDEILVVGPAGSLDALAASPGHRVTERGAAALAHLEQRLLVLRVPPGSPLDGETVAGSRLGELVDLTVVGILRDGRAELAVGSETPIRGGDALLVTGEPTQVLALLQLGGLEPEPEAPQSVLDSEDLTITEAVVAPRSEAAGCTLADLDFRERYGLQVLAVWREGKPIRSRLARLRLRFGDALLLQGPQDKIRLLAGDPDFVVLTERLRPPRRTRKAPLALGALALMVGLVVADVFPIHVASFAAAVLVLLARAVTMEEGYRYVEWRAIFLVAAILPVGLAMERTGAALFLAETAVAATGGLGPYALLAALVVLSSLLSQGLDGAPTVVLLGPVVVHAAGEVGVSPYPLMMGVGLAASAAFMTPFSHKANLLVMGAGGYKAMDYVRVGTPLTVAVLVLLTLLVPVLFPF